MPSSLVTLVKINVSNTGSGAITLGSAAEGYRGREVLTNGTVYSYSIQQGSAWEFGRATYLSESAQLVRSVVDSSDGGAAISLRPNAQVSLTALAEDLMPTTQLTAEIQANRDATVTAKGLAEAAAQTATTKANEASASAGQASVSEVRAAASVSSAEAIIGPTYTSIAAGLAATTNGQSFAVDNGDGTVTIYRNNAGSAVAQRNLATVAYNEARYSKIADLASTASGKGAELVGYGSNTSYADGTVGNELIPRVTRTGMKAIPGKQYKVAYLHEAGREGFFQCFPGSPPVTDTFEGLYIVANAGSFYWARIWDKVNARASWWGVSEASADIGGIVNIALGLAPVVILDPGTFWTLTQIKITKSGSVLRGAGQHYVDANSFCTRLLTTSATLNMFQIGADSFGGNVNNYERGMRLEDLYIGRTVGPDKTAKPVGVSMQFCLGAEINRVKSVDSTTSFKFTGAVAFYVQGTNANRVVAGTGTGTDEWNAYWLDGSVDIGLAGGNASAYFFQTQAGCNISSLQTGTSRAYRCTGKFQDTFFKRIESVSCNIGISLEGGAGSGDANIKIEEPIMDAVFKWGIFANGLSAQSSVDISKPNIGMNSSTQFGIYLNNCQGSVTIEGGDVLGGGFSGQGVALVDCKGVTINETKMKEIGGIGVGTSGSCSNLVICSKHHNPTVSGGPAVQINGTAGNASTIAPIVYGKASAFTFGVQVVGAIDARNEYNMSGVDSACISGGSANKLVRNGAQITATGMTGTNLASGVMT